MNDWMTRSRKWAVALVASATVLATSASRAADHRDSPRLMADTANLGSIDINDVYLFQSPANKANTVIIVTMSPAAGLIGPGVFNPYASYEIRIQNTAAIADNIVFQLGFSFPDAFGRQQVQVVKQTGIGQPLVTQSGVAPPGAISNQVVAFGTTGTPMSVKGGGTFTAGLFDDPFFFDLNAYNKFVMLANAGASLSVRVSPFFNPNFPNNFFANYNVLALVLEVPTTSLLSSKTYPKLGVWMRTVVNGVQFDRMGRPAINTAAIPQNFKDVFNLGTPFTDSVLFTNPMTEDITHLYGVSEAYAFSLTKVLLPDLLTIDTSKPSGFLNGRLLTDDVIDAEFKILTNGALTSDRVGNDSVFENYFPYIGTAQPRNPLNPAPKPSH